MAISCAAPSAIGRTYPKSLLRALKAWFESINTHDHRGWWEYIQKKTSMKFEIRLHRLSQILDQAPNTNDTMSHGDFTLPPNKHSCWMTMCTFALQWKPLCSNLGNLRSSKAGQPIAALCMHGRNRRLPPSTHPHPHLQSNLKTDSHISSHADDMQVHLSVHTKRNLAPDHTPFRPEMTTS